MNCKSIFILFFLFQSAVCFAQKKAATELTILGIVHYPTRSVNTDTVYAAISKVNPDVILLELDSSYFTSNFILKQVDDENEIVASTKYINDHKKCLLRPFDIEGREAQRKKMGIENADKVAGKIRTLYFTNALGTNSTNIWKRFSMLTDSLVKIGDKSLDTINSLSTDNLVAERQLYQYKKLKEIIETRKEFQATATITPQGDTLSFKEVFSRYAYFEVLRNKAMVSNILKMVKKYPSKKILVLTGFFHRDFLLTEF